MRSVEYGMQIVWILQHLNGDSTLPHLCSSVSFSPKDNDGVSSQPDVFFLPLRTYIRM